MSDRVPEIQFSGTRNQPKNGLKTSWTRIFIIFCQFFFPYLMTFQSSSAPLACSILKNRQKWHFFFVKKRRWRKALFNLPSTHFSMIQQVVPETRVSGTRSATNWVYRPMIFYVYNKNSSFPICSVVGSNGVFSMHTKTALDEILDKCCHAVNS